MCVRTSLTTLQPPLLSLLLRSVVHYTCGELAPIERAAWTSSWSLRSLYLCLSPAISLSFPPFLLLSPPPHTGSLIYLAFVNSSSLFTSSSGIQIVHLFQPPLLSPVSVSLFSHQSPDYLYQYISKVTPLTHISPSSSLTLIFNIFFVLFSLVLTKNRRSSWPCPSAERFWWIRPVSFSLPPPNKAVLPGLRY